MPDDDLNEAAYYSLYVFDCPECGGQTMIGGTDPGETETCDDCNATIRMIHD